MGLDGLPLAIECDVSVVSVVAELSQLGHELGQVVKAHVRKVLKYSFYHSPMLNVNVSSCEYKQV